MGRSSLPAWQNTRNSLWDYHRGEFGLQECDFSLEVGTWCRAMGEIQAPHISCPHGRLGTQLLWELFCQQGFLHHLGQDKH